MTSKRKCWGPGFEDDRIPCLRGETWAAGLVSVGVPRGFTGFEDAAAALPGLDDLLEAEGDDEADCEGNDVYEDGGWLLRVVRPSYRMVLGCGYGCL